MAKLFSAITLLILTGSISCLTAHESPEQALVVYYLFHELELPLTEIPTTQSQMSLETNALKLKSDPQKVTHQQQQQPQGQIQYVYVPYNPQTQTPPPGSYTYQPQPQQYAPMQQVHPTKPASDGPQVGEVMGAFAGVLGSIVTLGLADQNNNSEQQMAGINMFINSAAAVITALTRKPYSAEQFTETFLNATKRMAQKRNLPLEQ